MKIAGLDIGTTGCKCTVFDEDGKYLDKAYRDYPVRRGIGGHEIDVTVVMDAVYEVIREMVGRFPDIGGLGVTSFGETCVFADSEGNPLMPSMLYTDPRGGDECREIISKFGENKVTYVTGLRPHEMYSISKIMWVRKHKPEVWADTKQIFQMEDFVVYHLTGVRQIDYSLATRTMTFDIKSLKWSDEIHDAVMVDSDLFSKPVPSGSPAGHVTERAAELTGLSRDAVIVSISQDQVAAAVGAGVFDGDTAVDGAGTVECLTPIYDGLPDIDEMYKGYFSVVPYVVPGTYVTYAFSYMGGALIQWCVDNFAKEEKQRAADRGMSVNEYLENKYREKHGNEPSGLLVLPHLAGAATPYMDIASRGAVIGLEPDTGVEELYHGCLEGVAYEMYLNLQALKDTGIHFDRLHATGGGARSKEWMQMKADVLNLPITALRTTDAGTVGSAMLTGIAIGVYKDLQDAAGHMVEKTEVYEPDKTMHEKYMERYEKYCKVYEAVRPLI